MKLAIILLLVASLTVCNAQLIGMLTNGMRERLQMAADFGKILLNPIGYIRQRTGGDGSPEIVERVKGVVKLVVDVLKNGTMMFIPTIPDSTFWSASEENGRNSILGFLSSKRRFTNDNFTYKHVDYKKAGFISPVKNQGKCGSCYAFGGCAAIEAQQRFHGVGNDILSEQEVVDCSYKKYSNAKGALNLGCTSGTSYHTMKYLAEEDHALESTYKYTGRHTECRYDVPRVPKQGLHFQEVSVKNEDHAAYLLEKNGPYVVYIIVNQIFNLYKSGIFNHPSCSGAVNHAMLLVGCDQAADGTEYWILKNSWGDKWGDGGYIRFIKGKNMCDMFTNNVTIASYKPIITE